MLDVVIIGGGPAGLSAAVVLGRCRRKVVLIDAGQRRNRRARGMHNYLTRDGVPPHEFIAAARAEAARYGVEMIDGEAASAEALRPSGFRVATDAGGELFSRALLLATGVRDMLPRIEGFDELYGTSVHHCPYCDGWEHRDQRLAAFGDGLAAVGLALALRTWSEQVTACTNGHALSAHDRGRAERNGIAVREEGVTRLEGERAILRRMHFQSGPVLECDAMFFNTGQVQRSGIPAALGCRFKDDGGVVTSDRQCTDVPGLYLAGDADREVQFVIVAAAEGATAATAINRQLQDEDRGEPKRDVSPE